MAKFKQEILKILQMGHKWVKTLMVEGRGDVMYALVPLNIKYFTESL